MGYAEWMWVIVGIELAIMEALSFYLKVPPLTSAMRNGSVRWMLWPAVFGTLCGHFFGTAGAPKGTVYILFPLAAAVLYRDFFVHDVVPRSTHMEVFLLFLGIGAWVWGSRVTP